jgi:hypothetical protein
MNQTHSGGGPVLELRSNIERVVQGRSEAICNALREVRFVYLSFGSDSLGSVAMHFHKSAAAPSVDWYSFSHHESHASHSLQEKHQHYCVQAGKKKGSRRIDRPEMVGILHSAGINNFPTVMMDSLWSALKANAEGVLASDLLVYFVPIKVARYLNKLNKKADHMRHGHELAVHAKRFQQAASLERHLHTILHEIDVRNTANVCIDQASVTRSDSTGVH